MRSVPGLVNDNSLIDQYMNRESELQVGVIGFNLMIPILAGLIVFSIVGVLGATNNLLVLCF
ncbi:hypothetical protein [Clostridium vincentii]|uniref:Uncharacterized protein n=1 Tax=Clostridium vincentii TaxID=52704 RepID=A0A2T0BH90_9CLOT|nr:hypothetical protein [Clostridium vincentii]PRR83244.1 hypothetical protein CLVI_10430 [Clostridium vincentii]